MLKFWKFRKSLSPIIATVLLLILVVGMVALVWFAFIPFLNPTSPSGTSIPSFLHVKSTEYTSFDFSDSEVTDSGTTIFHKAHYFWGGIITASEAGTITNASIGGIGGMEISFWNNIIKGDNLINFSTILQEIEHESCCQPIRAQVQIAFEVEGVATILSFEESFTIFGN